MGAPPVAARLVGGWRVSVETLRVDVAVSVRRASVVDGDPAATVSRVTARTPTMSRKRARIGAWLIDAIVPLRVAGDGPGTETRNSSERVEPASRERGQAARGWWAWAQMRRPPDRSRALALCGGRRSARPRLGGLTTGGEQTPSKPAPARAAPATTHPPTGWRPSRAEKGHP